MNNKFLTIASLMFVALSMALVHPSLAQNSGEQIYTQRCAGCHDIADSRAPSKAALNQMSISRIIRTMDFGIMMSVTYMLDRDQRQSVAQYLGVAGEETQISAMAMCNDLTVGVPTSPTDSWNGWSPEPTNTRFQANPGINANQVGSLELKWAFGFAGDVNAFAPPAVLDQQMFVGSAGGLIYALDAQSGCIQWAYQADGPVRTAMVVAPLESSFSEADNALLFGDQAGGFYALGAETGELLWRARPESHEATKLTGTPQIYNGVVYVPVASWEESRPLNPEYQCCTFRGSIVAYDINNGEQLWKSFLVPQEPVGIDESISGVPMFGPSGVGTWSAPTLDVENGLLYIATGNNITGMTAYSDAVVAMNLSTGAIVWSTQLTAGDEFNLYCRRLPEGCPGEDFDFGAAPVLETLANGQRVLLMGQKSGLVYGLDPDKQGEVLWQTRVGEGGINGGVQWGMASDGNNVYAAVSDVGRIQQSDRDAVDPRPTGVDPNTGGGLSALRINDGSLVWFAEPAQCDPAQVVCSPAQPAAVSVIPGAVFSGSVDGHLRAFSVLDGSMLWDFDTAQQFNTVNGVEGRGGSIDGDGAVIANGMVYITSGYVRNGGMPGNVLLGFGLPE